LFIVSSSIVEIDVKFFVSQNRSSDLVDVRKEMLKLETVVDVRVFFFQRSVVLFPDHVTLTVSESFENEEDSLIEAYFEASNHRFIGHSELE
jgi:hypothetical protein